MLRLGKTISIAVTGWAMDQNAKYRLGVDYALPLSDHADYDQLIETVRNLGDFWLGSALLPEAGPQ